MKENMKMEWTKIPTDLLQSATDDKDILAIVKYQLLWAMLEREPEEKICLRYMTSKQLQRALDYTSAIQRRVNADISSVVCNRNRQKMFYLKNQTLKEKPNGYNNGYTNEADKNKIRIEEYKEENKKELKPYGEFKRVLLDDETYNKLNTQHGGLLLQAIEKLDAWLDKDENKKHRNQNHRGYFKSNGWVWNDLKQPDPVVDMSKYETNKDPFEL